MKKKNSSMNQICYIAIVLFLFAFTLVGAESQQGIETFIILEDEGLVHGAGPVLGTYEYDPATQKLTAVSGPFTGTDPIDVDTITLGVGGSPAWANYYAANSTAGGGGPSQIFEVQPNQQLTDQDGTVLPLGYYAFETDNSVSWQLIKVEREKAQCAPT